MSTSAATPRTSKVLVLAVAVACCGPRHPSEVHPPRGYPCDRVGCLGKAVARAGGCAGEEGPGAAAVVAWIREQPDRPGAPTGAFCG